MQDCKSGDCRKGRDKAFPLSFLQSCNPPSCNVTSPNPGGSPDDRLRAARANIPASHTPLALDARALPFLRAEDVVDPAAPRVILIDDVHLAFPDAQTGGTRLVLTQSTYLLQKWVDRLDEGDRIVATADRAALERCAPEAFQGRGPWQYFGLIDDKDTKDTKDVLEDQTFVSPVSLCWISLSPKLLERAFSASEPAERLRLCREAIALEPASAVAHLALASACRENRDGGGARDALDRAAALAPEWEAVAYESGKLYLVNDDMARARDAFQRAADLMPAFSAAFSNLGATLGELDEPAAALRRVPPGAGARSAQLHNSQQHRRRLPRARDGSTNRRRRFGR